MSRLALPLEALSVVSTAPDHVQDNILLHVTLIKPLPFFVRSGHYNDWAIPTYRYPSIYVKWSRYMPDVVQRVGRGIALIFHDRGSRRKWVVSSTPRPHFTPGKEPVPILQEAGWAPGPAWTGGKSRPHRDSIPDRPARSQSLYRLSYPILAYSVLRQIYL